MTVTIWYRSEERDPPMEVVERVRAVWKDREYVTVFTEGIGHLQILAVGIEKFQVNE